MNTTTETELAPQPQRANDYIATLGLKYEARFVPQSYSRNAEDKTPTLNWKIKISNERGSIDCDYSQGCGLIPGYQQRLGNNYAYSKRVIETCETGVNRLLGFDFEKTVHTKGYGNVQPPEMADVLHSLVLDASALGLSFDMWCEEFGYDQDSRKAHAIYSDCVDYGHDLRQMLDLEKLQEALQDY